MKVILKKYLLLLILINVFFSGCNNQTTTEDNEKEHPEKDNSKVALTTEQYKVADIQLGKIEKKNLSSLLKVNGTLQAPPQSLVTISAVLGGFVKHTDLIHGSQVKEGDVLVVMEHPDFIQLQQDYLENKNKLVFLELEFLRQKKLQEKNVSSEKVYQQATADYKGMKARVNELKEKLALIGINVEQLEKSEKISRTITIHSPINGYVTRMNINVGKYVHPADIMFEIVNAEHMHVELTVFEKDIHKIKTG